MGYPEVPCKIKFNFSPIGLLFPPTTIDVQLLTKRRSLILWLFKFEMFNNTTIECWFVGRSFLSDDGKSHSNHVLSRQFAIPVVVDREVLFILVLVCVFDYSEGVVGRE